MKNILAPIQFTRCLWRNTTLAILAVFLLASQRAAQAQITVALITGETNVYSYYDSDGGGSFDGLDPSNPFSGESLGVPLPGSGLYQYYTPIPAGTVTVSGANISPFATAEATFDLGDDPTGAVGGATLLLDNPNSYADEVRLDWYGIYYVISAAAGSTLFLNSTLTANVTGQLQSAGSFYALAGQVAVYDIHEVTINSDILTTTIATIGSGSGTLSPYTPPGTSPCGAGPWIGATAAAANTSFTSSDSEPFDTTSVVGFPAQDVTAGDTIVVQGYLDLVVDPGVVEVQLSFAPASIHPVLTGEKFNKAGGTTVNVLGTPNTKNILQATCSLTPPVTWTNLTTNFAPAGVWQYTDPNTSQIPARFYRACTAYGSH
jgi:type II secretory pathway pseudopilin PulG